MSLDDLSDSGIDRGVEDLFSSVNSGGNPNEGNPTKKPRGVAKNTNQNIAAAHISLSETTETPLQKNMAEEIRRRKKEEEEAKREKIIAEIKASISGHNPEKARKAGEQGSNIDDIKEQLELLLKAHEGEVIEGSTHLIDAGDTEDDFNKLLDRVTGTDKNKSKK